MVETVYYDMTNDAAYRYDSSRITSGNCPKLRYRSVKSLNIQLLNSAMLTDYYTDLAGVTVTASAAVDNDAIHYDDGTVATGITGGVAIPTVAVAGLSIIPRICGRLKLTNATPSTETINYNGWSCLAGVYTFTLADASYVVGPQTPVNSYIVGCAVRVLQLPILKDPTVGCAGKATGLFTVSLDCDNIIFQEMIEGTSSIASCHLELQVFNTLAKRIIVKEIPVALDYLLDDDGAVAPAPTGDYYTSTEINALLLAGRTFRFATGVSGAWHSTQAANDNYYEEAYPSGSWSIPIYMPRTTGATGAASTVPGPTGARGQTGATGASATGSGLPTLGAEGQALAITGGVATWMKIGTNNITGGAVALAQMADLAESRIIGRATGAGTGVPTALTAAQLRAIANVTFGANAYVHPNHSGEVTSVADGAQTIADEAVTLAKQAHLAESRIQGRATGAGTGDVTALTPAQVRAIVNVTFGANAYVHPNHSGEVTSVADGAQTIAAKAVTMAKLADIATLSVIGRSATGTGIPSAITAGTDQHVLRRSGVTLAFGTTASGGIANDAIETAKVKDANITLAKMANLAESTLIGRATGAGAGVPTALTPTQVRTMLNISATGSFDADALATVINAATEETNPDYTNELALVEPATYWSAQGTVLDPFNSYLKAVWNLDDEADDLGANELTNDGVDFSTAGMGGINAADFEAGDTDDLFIDTVGDDLKPSSKFAIAFWVKLESQPAEGGTYVFFATTNKLSPPDYNFHIQYSTISGAGRLYAQLSQGSDHSQKTITVTSQTLTTGTWFHLAYIADGTNIKLYKNGAQIGTSTAYDGTICQHSTAWHFGNRLSDYYDGLISRCYFWSGSGLSDAAVTALYNSGTGAFWATPSPIIVLRKLLISTLRGGGPTTIYKKTSDQTWTSDTVLATIAGIGGPFTLKAGRYYSLVTYLFTSSHATPDWNFNWNFNSTKTCYWSYLLWDNAEYKLGFITSADAAQATASTTALYPIIIKQQFFCPSDEITVTLEAAQRASSASAITIYRGSFSVLTELG